MRKGLVYALVLVFGLVLFGVGAPAMAAESKIVVFIDGKELVFSESDGLGVPFIDANSRTMVPIRKTLEMIGAAVNFQDNTVIIEKDGVTVSFVVGGKAYVNGAEYYIDTRAVIVDERSYIPIRFALEPLGYYVSWDAAFNTVVISHTNRPFVLPEEPVDEIARELFEKVLREISRLVLDEGISNMPPPEAFGVDAWSSYGSFVVSYETVWIDGRPYWETNLPYKNLRDYYAKTYTGEALDLILSTRWTEVDGKIYANPQGGASGWGLENIEVKLVAQNGNEYTYEGRFDISIGFVEEYSEIFNETMQFSIKKVEDGYRISSLRDIPDGWLFLIFG